MAEEGGSAPLLFLEGWLDVSEVLCCMDGYGGGQMKEDKQPGVVPSWEPYLCLLNVRSKKLLHFRSEKAAEDYISQMLKQQGDLCSTPSETLLREWVGPSSREEFYRKNKYDQRCVADLLLVSNASSTANATSTATTTGASQLTKSVSPHSSQLYSAKMVAFQNKSQTLDNRTTTSQLISGMNEAGHEKAYSHSTSVVDKRRGSGSSLCSDESTSKQQGQHNQNQSKFANFFSRKSQQIKSNLKRTKSATKLDRKKTNGDSDGPSLYESEGTATFSHSDDSKLPPPPSSTDINSTTTTDNSDMLKRSASTGRLSKKWLHRSTNNRSSVKKTLSGDSERMSSCMRTSHSHEALLTSSHEAHNSLDLSRPDILVHNVHSSIWSVDHCFVVRTHKPSPSGPTSPTSAQGRTDTLGVPTVSCNLGSGHCQTRYYRCGSDADMQRWILSIKNCIDPNRDQHFRTDNTLSLSIVESKNLAPKKRFFCEVYLDKVLYARTSSKLMLDHVFWGEQFVFGSLPNIQTITVHLFRDADKKKKREKPFRIGSINIPTKEIRNIPMCEKWYDVNSPSARKGGRESRIEGVGVRIKGRYLSVDILPTEYYQPLLRFVQTEYSSLVELLEPAISVKAKEGVATCLASTLHCTSHVVSFLCEIVMSEVDRLENNALALRGNSIATKAVEAYMKLVGQKYLVSTLKDVLRAVIDPSVDCEVDPSRLGNNATLTENRQTLISNCTLIWCKIINSCSSFPSELKRLFQMIKYSCDRRSNISSSVCRQLISSCVFLRFFCPAILSPSLFSIIQEFPSDRGVRNLTLVAKTIQSLANLTQKERRYFGDFSIYLGFVKILTQLFPGIPECFGGKEKFMDFMNGFVSREIVNMEDYLDKISTLNEDDENKSYNIVIDQGRELAILHSLLVESLKEIPEESRNKHSDLSTILDDVTTALKNVPTQVRRQPFNGNNNNATPVPCRFFSHTETGQRPVKTSTNSVPPYTPTTIVLPVTPIAFSPLPDCSDFPTTSSYVSMISKSLSTTPLMAICGSSSSDNNYTSNNLQNNIYNKISHSSSNTDGSVFASPDFSVINPSVRSAAVVLDEQQINTDWRKIMEAAVQSSEDDQSISLVDFGDRANLRINCDDDNVCSGGDSGSSGDHLPPVANSDPTLCNNNNVPRQPLSFNNPSYRCGQQSPNIVRLTKTSKHHTPGPMSASHDNLKFFKGVSGLTSSSNSAAIHPPSHLTRFTKNTYRSNSSDSIANCSNDGSKSQKVLSGSTPRVDSSSEAAVAVRQQAGRSAPTTSKSKLYSMSKSFDASGDLPVPATVMTASVRSTAHPSSERLYGVPGSTKNPPARHLGGNFSGSRHGNNARRQTVHYDAGGVLLKAEDPNSKFGFGSLPPQSSKGRGMQGSVSSPRLLQGSESTWSQRSSTDSSTDNKPVFFSSGPTERSQPPNNRNLPSNLPQQHRSSNQHRVLGRLNSQPLSPLATPTTASTPISEQQQVQQVSSARISSIKTALQQQRNHSNQNHHHRQQQQQHQQWNSVLEYDRRSPRTESKVFDFSNSTRPTFQNSSFHRSFSTSQPSPASTPSHAANSKFVGRDFRSVDPMSPSSINHAKRLEFFSSSTSKSSNPSYARDDGRFGFGSRDSNARSSAYSRLSTNKQRDGLQPTNPVLPLKTSQLKTPTGRSSPSTSFVSLTNQSRKTSRYGDSPLNKHPTSSTNQHTSMLVYNVENDTAESAIICKSTPC